MDEALAEAIDSKFYDAFKEWKPVKFHESPEVKVVCFERRGKNYRNISSQAGQWVEFWRNHLVDRATPKDLVDVILAKKNKNLGKAKKLQKAEDKGIKIGQKSKIFVNYFSLSRRFQIFNAKTSFWFTFISTAA